MVAKRLALGLMVVACGGGRTPGDGDVTATESGADAGETNPSEPNDGSGDDGDTAEPEPEPAGPADYPPGRRLRRLTADQYARSLEIATGEVWPDYETYAAAMGRADYAEITSEDREFSVTFDKFIHDAARWSCRAAVEGGGDAILRQATLDDTGEAKLRDNLVYLMLRFLAVDAAPDAESLDPYLTVLQADDVAMSERWIAVCIALATHPDFIAY